MKLKTLIIDDEPIALEKLRNYVEKVPFLQLVAECRNGIEASDALRLQKVDVIFTDINMPDMNGLEFVGSLTESPLIVFITAHSDYAVDSYRYSAVDYLMKPYSFADLQRAANKVLDQYNMRLASRAMPVPGQTATHQSQSLFVKVDYRFVRVNLSEIRYIKGYGEYLQIFTIDSDTPVVTLSSFNTIKDRLTPNFIQVHRSYIVNMDCAMSISKGRIVMSADTYIPVGESYKSQFQAYLASHSIGSKK